nr:phosphotransferase [Calditrichia bacterium]
MDLIRFQEILEAVPASHWESHLDIGDFAGVECLTTVTRTFSHVARCRVSGTRSRVMVYAKIYRKGLEDPQNWSDEEMFHEQEKMSYWYELFKGNETFGVVRPLGVIPELKMGLTQESQGKVLEELIANKLSLFPGRSAIRELEEALFAVGQWLKYKDEVLTPVPGRYPMEELFEYVDLRLRLLVEEGAHGFDAARRREIMDFFRNNAAAIPPKHLGMVYTHSDFNPGNILIDGKKVTVLDFGRKVEDSALLDMVKLCH